MSHHPAQSVHGSRNIVIAYVLWFFFGTLGIHKFYLSQNTAGIIYLVLGVIGYATVAILIGLIFLIPLFVAMFIDLFTMPGRVRELNGGAISY